MDVRDVRRLVPGVSLFWHDPSGSCSRTLTLRRVRSDDVVVLTDPLGGDVECRATELTVPMDDVEDLGELAHEIDSLRRAVRVCREALSPVAAQHLVLVESALITASAHAELADTFQAEAVASMNGGGR